MHKLRVILRGQTIHLFYIAEQLNANSLKKKMLMIMKTARRINLSHKPLSCDMSVSVAHDICTALAVVLFYFSEHGHPV